MPRGHVISAYVKGALSERLDQSIEEGEFPTVSAAVVAALTRLWQGGEGAGTTPPDFEAAANLNPEYMANLAEELSFGFTPSAGPRSQVVHARISEQHARALEVLVHTPGFGAETKSDVIRGFVHACLKAIDRLRLEELDSQRWHTWLLVGMMEEEKGLRDLEAKAITQAASFLSDDLAANRENLSVSLGLYQAYVDYINRFRPASAALGRKLLSDIPLAGAIESLLDQRIEP